MYRFLQNLPKVIKKSQFAGTHVTSNHGPTTLKTKNSKAEECAILVEHINRDNNATRFPWLNPVQVQDLLQQLHEKGRTFGAKDDRGPKFRGRYTQTEALGWGTAVLIGIQLCRCLSSVTFPDSDSSKKKLTFARLLPLPPTSRHVLPPSRDDNQNHKEDVITRSVTSEQVDSDGGSDDSYSLDSSGTTSESYFSHQSVSSDDSAPRNKEPVFLEQPHIEQNKFIPILEATMQTMDDIHRRSQGAVHAMIGAQYAQMGNMEQALDHFTLGSKLGSSKAQYNLGVCYEHGKGVPADVDKAITLYHQAAEQGHPLATYNFATLILSERVEGLEKEDAIKLMEAAAKAGVTHAQRYLGNFYLHHSDTARAAFHLKTASKTGDPESMYLLGLCYEQGWGVKKSEHRASKLFFQAAEMGYPLAQYSLGLYHEKGQGGVPQSKVRAVDLFAKASSAGLDIAKERLQQIKSNKNIPKVEITPPANSNQPSSTLKNKHKSLLNSALHVSKSDPTLQKTDHQNQFKNSTLTKKLSYLSLVLPNMFYQNDEQMRRNSNIQMKSGGTKGSLKIESCGAAYSRVYDDGDRVIRPSFQVGGDDEDKDFYEGGGILVSDMSGVAC